MARQQNGSARRERTGPVPEKLNTKDMTRKPAPKPDPGKPGAFLPNRARAKAGMNRGIPASCWRLLGKRVEHKAVFRCGGATLEAA
jgi:hypothetical protein